MVRVTDLTDDKMQNLSNVRQKRNTENVLIDYHYDNFYISRFVDKTFVLKCKKFKVNKPCASSKGNLRLMAYIKPVIDCVLG